MSKEQKAIELLSIVKGQPQAVQVMWLANKMRMNRDEAQELFKRVSSSQRSEVHDDSSRTRPGVGDQS